MHIFEKEWPLLSASKPALNELSLCFIFSRVYDREFPYLGAWTTLAIPLRPLGSLVSGVAHYNSIFEDFSSSFSHTRRQVWSFATECGYFRSLQQMVASGSDMTSMFFYHEWYHFIYCSFFSSCSKQFIFERVYSSWILERKTSRDSLHRENKKEEGVPVNNQTGRSVAKRRTNGNRALFKDKS